MQNAPAEPVAIADMADMFGVTHRTLHFYEEKGLISAGRIGLMRVYKHQDVNRMALINTCREIGMPVAVIQDLMAQLAEASTQEEADETFHTALMIRKRELTADLSTIQRQSQHIEKLLSPDPETSKANIRSDRDRIGLTDQEQQCIELMAEGYAPMRLARVLDMKSDEIAELEGRIIRKFGANNRFQAVAKAVLLGIVAS